MGLPSIRFITKNSWLNWKCKGAEALNVKRKPQSGIILCRREATEVKAPNRLLLSVMTMLLAAAWIGTVGSLCGAWNVIGPWLPILISALCIAG